MEKRFEFKTDKMECWIEDTEKNSDYNWYDMEKLCNLLNEQDDKIKELEEKLETKESINRAYEATLRLKDYDFSDLVRENQQLKQSQNSKAIEVLEKVKNDIILNIPDKYGEIRTLPNGYSTYYVDRPTVITFINNQITKLRGGK